GVERHRPDGGAGPASAPVCVESRAELRRRPGGPGRGRQVGRPARGGRVSGVGGPVAGGRGSRYVPPAAWRRGVPGAGESGQTVPGFRPGSRGGGTQPAGSTGQAVIPERHAGGRGAYSGRG